MRPDLDRLRALEIEELRQQLADAQDALRAIRAGEVDALVVQTSDGARVFALESAFELYRAFVENMQEGAAALTPDGLVLFANERLSDITGVPATQLLGASIYEILGEAHRPVVEGLLGGRGTGLRAGEIVLTRADGRTLHTYFSVTVMPDGTRCAVVTDLTERVRLRQVLASRELLRVTLTSIGDAVMCCDVKGLVTFLNPLAEALTGWSEQEALGQPVPSVCCIVNEVTHEPAEDLVARALREGTVVTLAHQAALVRRDGREVSIEDSAAPIKDDAGNVAGAVLVFHDVTQRRAAERALTRSLTDVERAKLSAERARVAAEEANRAKDRFLAILSHELRTPLTPVLMNVFLLEADGTLSAQARRSLEVIRRNVVRESRLIDDLLDLTDGARGAIQMNRQVVDFSAVISEVMDARRPNIDRCGLRAEVDLGQQSVRLLVAGDPRRLQQVVSNLVDNAIKFTSRGGRVAVRCREENEQVVVEVSDSGMGIEPAILPRVFDSFSQADASPLTRQFGGLGLGLAITRMLVELHGGTIEVHSEGRDKGATLRVRLPLLGGEPGGVPARAPAVPRGTEMPKLRILLVDDDGDTTQVLAAVLEMAGHEVRTAASVATALETAAQARFDLLLSDLGLPDGTGHDLMRELRARGSELPGIALSGYGQQTDIDQSLAAGFSEHMVKPADPDVLLQKIDKVARAVGHLTDSSTEARSSSPTPRIVDRALGAVAMSEVADHRFTREGP